MGGATMPTTPISGLAVGDAMALTDIPYDSAGTATLNSATDVLTVTEGGNSYTLQLAGDLTGDTFNLSDPPGPSPTITIGLAVPTPTLPRSQTPHHPNPYPAPNPTNLAVYNTTMGQPLSATAQPYTGPVSGLTSEYLSVTTDSLNVSVSSPG